MSIRILTNDENTENIKNGLINFEGNRNELANVSYFRFWNRGWQSLQADRIGKTQLAAILD